MEEQIQNYELITPILIYKKGTFLCPLTLGIHKLSIVFVILDWGKGVFLANITWLISCLFSLWLFFSGIQNWSLKFMLFSLNILRYFDPTGIKNNFIV